MNSANYSYVRKLFMIVFSAAMCFGVNQNAQAQTAITSCNQLQAMTDTSSYVLSNDIDCKNEVFSPIPLLSAGRILDGAGHKIFNLKIDRAQDEKVGLFLKLDNARVKNLEFVNVNISGGRFVGSVAAEAVNGTIIENVHVGGSVKGSNHVRSQSQYVGGLVGSIADSQIIRSTSSSLIKGYNHNGGLVGLNHKSMISDSFAEGFIKSVDMKLPAGINWNDVSTLGWNDTASINWDDAAVTNWSNSSAVNWGTATFVSGGLVGAMNVTVANNTAANGVSNSYSFVKTLVENLKSNIKLILGGVIGKNDGASNGNVYATGLIQATGPGASGINWDDSLGGIIGTASTPNSSAAMKSYWDKDTTKMNKSSGSSTTFGQSSVNMKKQATYNQWDFASDWKICENQDYPSLKWEGQLCLNSLFKQVLSRPTAYADRASSLSIDGNIMVVGNPYYNSSNGRVSVYERIGLEWVPINLPSPNTTIAGSNFGYKVFVQGDILYVVGKKYDTGFREDVLYLYTYKRTNNVWSEVGSVQGKSLTDVATGVSIQKDTLAAITNNELTIYNKIVNGWSNAITFRDFVEAQNHLFTSVSVSEDGNMVALGVQPPNTTSFGKVIIFSKVSGAWIKNQVVEGHTPYDTMYVHLSNSSMITASSPLGCASSYIPKLNVYKFNGSSWVFDQYLSVRGELEGINDGYIAAFKNNRALVYLGMNACLDGHSSPNYRNLNKVLEYQLDPFSGKWHQRVVEEFTATSSSGVGALSEDKLAFSMSSNNEIHVFSPSMEYPDLAVLETTAPVISASGANVTVSFKVKNQGTVTSAASKVRIAIDGVALALESVGSLSPGSTVSFVKTYPSTATSYFKMGQHNIVVTADAENVVSESFENNNSSSAATNVVFRGKVTKLDKVTPIANVKVIVRQGTKQIAVVYTDTMGYFQVANLANPDLGKEYVVNPQLTGYTIPAQKITTVYVGEMKFNSTNK